MKKLVLIGLAFCILGSMSLAKDLTSSFEIPLETEEVLTVIEYTSFWIVYKNGRAVINPYSKKGKRSARFYSFGECKRGLKEMNYEVLKIIKDAIDDDYFFCVRKKEEK